MAREVARMLRHLAAAREEGRRGMLIAEIDGAPATAHPAARVFVEAGFSVTAMGLQARIAGIRVAAASRGGISMANREQDLDKDLDVTAGSPGERNIETSEQEQETIRNSNDLDQELEREGIESRRNRGYDEAVRGQNRDVDPDSAEADVDRDDSVTD
jgi:hypothetical protein